MIPKYETKVGSTVFVIGRLHNAPANAWYHAQYVVGETRVSWLVSQYSGAKSQDAWAIHKVSKKALADNGVCDGYYVSANLLEQAWYVRVNGWRIANAVDFVRDYDKLKQIAAIIDYKEEKA